MKKYVKTIFILSMIIGFNSAALCKALETQKTETIQKIASDLSSNPNITTLTTNGELPKEHATLKDEANKVFADAKRLWIKSPKIFKYSTVGITVFLTGLFFSGPFFLAYMTKRYAQQPAAKDAIDKVVKGTIDSTLDQMNNLLGQKDPRIAQLIDKFIVFSKEYLAEKFTPSLPTIFTKKIESVTIPEPTVLPF